jgi:hypothetical protein
MVSVASVGDVPGGEYLDEGTEGFLPLLIEVFRFRCC